MAKIGLTYAVYKTATNSGIIGRAIESNINIQTADVKLYADNGIAETDKSFLSGTISLNFDDLSDEVQTNLLGHTNDDGEIIANVDDIPQYAGIGVIVLKQVRNVLYHRAIWLTQVQFAEPNDDNSTKGETVAFGTPTLDGTIMRDDSGYWKREKTFANYEDAVNYLNLLADLPTEESAGLTGLVVTGTGGTLSPSFGAGVRYYTFGGVTGATVKIKATAAGHIIKLTGAGESYTLTSGTDSPAIDIGIGSHKFVLTAQEPNKTVQTAEIIVVKVS